MRLGQAWSSIRGVIRGEFSFAGIKDMLGAAGLPIHELAHLQQKLNGGATKGQLMDGVDQLLNKQLPDDQDRIVAACITDAVKRKSPLEVQFDELLRRVGWGLTAGEPHPLALQIDVELATLPEAAAEGLRTSLVRYRDGDADGAMSAVCGVVDSLTAAIYDANGLGNPFNASYQERVSRALSATEASYRAPLIAGGLSQDEVTRLWQNHRSAINQAAYVLGTFRREFADTHGARTAPPSLVQRGLDCAVFIVRSLIPTGS